MTIDEQIHSTQYRTYKHTESSENTNMPHRYNEKDVNTQAMKGRIRNYIDIHQQQEESQSL